MNKRVTTADFRRMKQEGKSIAMLTAYDYSMATLVDASGIDAILVGDSLGNVVLGYDSTVPVNMDDMIHHLRAVTRGVKRAMVVGDMPFLSYHISREESVRNAGRLMQEGLAHAVKLEGGCEVADTVKAITDAGIPVMGHLGLTPQSVHQLGGFKVQGKDSEAAKRLLEDAKRLEQAGVFAIVLECIPQQLAKVITESISVPTIGIGAGVDCDGQVLVINDLLGMFSNFTPKFVKQYAKLKEQIVEACTSYVEEVKTKAFPGPEHVFNMNEDQLKKLY
ncbi:ketopantoate hydroxymethyltransferase [Desulforamulus reducens MI-1]|uniref:3-methyl-2-oxobutanoate hydroxymethyltransferase n=1 Tax=Desulforamulus reducens (strain ATCC BAA-1160 / DSM 100696 / MI-1) TaxID=349161 RepID=A4J5G0_DESRM|nr:3-methyl-2-oxobutanoate hydroxymethyltransferase [Desulforamulus reducens]ABO50313.1 ketopantoate hydroxymethyltransferase [Desulforamulus reducens MI-1]